MSVSPRVTTSVAVLLSAAVAGCGGGHTAHDPVGHLATVPTPSIAATAGHGCAGTVVREQADVARRVFRQAVRGQNVVAAVKRLQHSTALASAVASGSRAAIAAAFLPIRHQIVRIQIYRGGRKVYAYGTPPTFAPVGGQLLGPGGTEVGRFVIAATDQRAYAGFVNRLTGADVRFRAPGAAAAGTSRYAATLATRTYPAGRPLLIDLRFPKPPAALCSATPAATRLRTITAVAERILRAEGSGRAVAQTIDHIARDPAFRRATAADDVPAIRRAIIDDFFRDHSLHVVRVRVLRGARVIYDLGGNFVLQPVRGTVRSSDGRSAATFLVAVQDDTGYIKLVHRFTGADVQLRSPLGRVPGSALPPGLVHVPPSGVVHRHGSTYLTASLTGTAFPSGRLHILLLVRQPRAGVHGKGG